MREKDKTAEAMEAMTALGLSPSRLRTLQRSISALHRWYSAAARDLPWRRTRDPYAIWISEVMLQQTQVITVIPYYKAWMQTFPHVRALANADEAQVLRLWEGLGYYSRARSLHRAAQVVVERFAAQVPSRPEDFATLPGVGPYTAAAVLSIAFNVDLPVLDGNVRRVLSRMVALEHDPRHSPWARALEELAGRFLPRGTAALHNQAMMELGALLCTPRSPSCPACPLRQPCAARRSGHPASYPPRVAKSKIPHYDISLGLVFHQGRLFIAKRPYGGLLGGLWEFPGGKAEPKESLEEALVRELKEELGLVVTLGQELPTVRHAYSHFKVTLHPRLCTLVRMNTRASEGRPWCWIDPSDLPAYAMPRANRKVIEELEKYIGGSQQLAGGGKNIP